MDRQRRVVKGVAGASVASDSSKRSSLLDEPGDLLRERHAGWVARHVVGGFDDQRTAAAAASGSRASAGSQSAILMLFPNSRCATQKDRAFA